MRSLAVFLLLFITSLSNADAESSHWKVGAASTDISPADGTYLAGYGRNRRSTGRLDPLTASAVVIDDTKGAIAILTLDNIGLTRPDVSRIQHAVHNKVPELQAARVIVSSTHTHAGPDVVGLWGEEFWSSGRDETHIDQLIERAATTIAEAFERRKPARLRVANHDVPMDWVENVSEPDLLDRRLTVLQFIDADGQSIATLTNYACHPTVLGPENTLISADYVHGFVLEMSKALPGEHIFLQGAIGGWVQPLQGDRSHGLAISHGAQLAQGALALLESPADIPAEPIRFATTEIAVPLANWDFRLLTWIGVLDREITDDGMVTSVARFDLGSVSFVTHPGETSPAFSLESRQILGTEHTVVMGLTQDAMGYILKPDYFHNTDRYAEAEYLTSVSVGPEAGPALMAAIRTLKPE